jgi:hypothetical protein
VVNIPSATNVSNGCGIHAVPWRPPDVLVDSCASVDPVILTNVEPCTRIHRPSFTKTSRKCSFSVIENAHFGLVFTKTGSINLGTGVPVVARVSAAGVAVPILLLMSLLLPVFRTFLDASFCV